MQLQIFCHGCTAFRSADLMDMSFLHASQSTVCSVIDDLSGSSSNMSVGLRDPHAGITTPEHGRLLYMALSSAIQSQQ